MIDKNKYDEYIRHMNCVHYHILLSNIVSWVAKRHIDLWVKYGNFRMPISNTFLCDSLLCINSSKNGLITVYMYIIVRNILGMIYPEMSTCNMHYIFHCPYFATDHNKYAKQAFYVNAPAVNMKGLFNVSGPELIDLCTFIKCILIKFQIELTWLNMSWYIHITQ